MGYFKKGVKRFIALLSVAVLLAGSFPCSVKAQENTQRVYTHDSIQYRWRGYLWMGAFLCSRR